jgi:hypothetical protein
MMVWIFMGFMALAFDYTGLAFLFIFVGLLGQTDWK